MCIFIDVYIGVNQNWCTVQSLVMVEPDANVRSPRWFGLRVGEAFLQLRSNSMGSVLGFLISQKRSRCELADTAQESCMTLMMGS